MNTEKNDKGSVQQLNQGDGEERHRGDVAENRDFISLSHEMEIPMAEIARNGQNPGDVDENNHFTFLGNCGRRFLCLGKRD
jgi:hypothetical protein